MTLTVSARAVADDLPVGRAEIGTAMHSYYDGEFNAAGAVMGLSVLFIGTGATLVTRDGDFARGLGWPLLALGGLEAIGSFAYGLQVQSEIAHYSNLLATDPVAFRRIERAHLQGTISRFVYYRIAEIALSAAGAGLAIYGYAADVDTFKGVGIGLATVGVPLFIIDTYNQFRAVRYERQLGRFDATISFQAGGPTQPWMVGLAGRF